ncbi:MAG: class I SAM-dependent methyltransferase [bacterium]|nr:class I SAM-dependent methyltransferase [bacterium]
MTSWDDLHRRREPAAIAAYRELASHRFLRATLARLFVAGDTVLDIGCGRGEFVLELAGRGVNAVGLDSSPLAVETLRQDLRQSGLDPRRALTGDGRSPPFSGSSLDGIIALGLLEHFADHPAVLARWVELLKPGGRILLQVPNAERWAWFAFDVLARHLLLRRRWVAPRRTPRGLVSRIHGYEERWTASYLAGLCRQAGLEELESYSVYRACAAELGAVACRAWPWLERQATELPARRGLILVYAGRKLTGPRSA